MKGLGRERNIKYESGERSELHVRRLDEQKERKGKKRKQCTPQPHPLRSSASSLCPAIERPKKERPLINACGLYGEHCGRLRISFINVPFAAQLSRFGSFLTHFFSTLFFPPPTAQLLIALLCIDLKKRLPITCWRAVLPSQFIPSQRYNACSKLNWPDRQARSGMQPRW